MAETPQGPEAEVGEQRIGGNNSRMRSEVKAGLRIDTQQLSNLKKHLKEARDITKSWREEMDKLAKSAKEVQGSMGAAAGSGGSGGGNNVTDGFSNVPDAPEPTPSPTAVATGGGGFMRGLSRVGGVLGIAAPFLSSLTGQLDARIDRGMQYASSADKLNLLTQQMTGMSQMQAMRQRQELTEFRLGAGGINAATQFGLMTGQTITPEMARSIEAIRTSTGFSKSTADILNEQRQMMAPEVANRMFFMGGVNAYEIGGGMKDPLQMRQEIVDRMGLDNETVMRGALAPGSVTRARMADLGLGEEMQTEILQYAQQNMAFREQGGRGMYDPSKASHRQLMGIEDNLATQQEETQRVSDMREEQFMRRQIDNMAALERSNQDLIKAMASLEDTMSGLIGARISTRPKQQMLGGALKGIGGAMVAGGLASSGTGVGIGVAAVGGLLLAGGAMLGDPPEETAGGAPDHSSGAPASDGSRDSEIMVPSAGRGSARIPLSEFKNTARFTKLDSRLKEKLLRMMRENPNVGINSGYRSAADQERLFYAQMQETGPEDSQVEWNGKHWKSKPGYSFTAPPGRSMHETGLAADIFEDGDGRSYKWIVENSARFGLNNWRAKGWRHDEPWHVQPTEVPRYRSEWDRMTGGQSTYQPTDSAATNTSSGESDGAPGVGGAETATVGGVDTAALMQSAVSMGGVGSTFNPSGMTIEEAMTAARDLGLTRLMASGSGGWNDTLVAPGSGKDSAPSIPPSSSGGQRLTGEDVARLAYNAGFRGEDLVKVVAISKRESGWNTGAYNPDRSTGDDSYGLMQINMLGNLGPSRREWFGISNNDALYDPQTNMNAAFMMYSARGNSLYDWGAYKGEENTYNTNMAEALTAVTNAGYSTGSEAGDPMFAAPSRGSSTAQPRQGRSSTTHITSSPTINVAPVINFNGAPSTPDLRNIAQTVSRLIKEEVDMMNLRTS
jgi:hypothetical protein